MMKKLSIGLLSLVVALSLVGSTSAQLNQRQLANWLKRFPQADANGDGKLTVSEAQAFVRQRDRSGEGGGGAPREFTVDPGWKADRFPGYAVCYKSPEEIARIYAQADPKVSSPIESHPKPTDGSLRIIGTGHSFMAPAYKTLPTIAEAAGFEQQVLYTHTGGGMTGSTRYKWEEENGIFQFDGRPMPKLLASIANAEWDVMTWGPYFNDQPEYYRCWIEFCLKYNPQMKFYLSDAWPQMYQMGEVPKSEDALTDKLFLRLGREKHGMYAAVIAELNKEFDNRIFIMPTSDAMVLAVLAYHRGELPGVEGIHQVVGGKERSLWRDMLGHLGPGFGQLEGYVFYATLYGRSPELIEGDPFGPDAEYPSAELDRIFRKIAWQAVIHNPRSGVTDKNGDGLDDE